MRPRVVAIAVALVVSTVLIEPVIGLSDVPDGVLKVPGARLRTRDHVATDAARALNIIARTDNHRDGSYLMARRTVSDRVAGQWGLEPDALDTAWSTTTRAHQIAVLTALTQLDVSYREGEEIPYVSMDCSGLLWYAWRAAGVDMPRQSTGQLDRKLRIAPDRFKAGDVIGEGTHVHLWIGLERLVIHAPNDGGSVRFKMMSEQEWERMIRTDPTRIAMFRVS